MKNGLERIKAEIQFKIKLNKLIECGGKIAPMTVCNFIEAGRKNVGRENSNQKLGFLYVSTLR